MKIIRLLDPNASGPYEITRLDDARPSAMWCEGDKIRFLSKEEADMIEAEEDYHVK